MSDRIPYSILQLAALCRFWLTLLVDERMLDEFHWDASLCKEAADKIKPFTDACYACVPSST